MRIRRAFVPAILALGMAGAALTSVSAATAATYARTSGARVIVAPMMHLHGHAHSAPMMHLHGHRYSAPMMHLHG